MPYVQPSRFDRLACVIFDLDGTLAKTGELIAASFNHVARKYLGKTLTPSEVVALFGPPEDGGLRRLLETDDCAAAMDDLCLYYETEHDAMASLHTGIRELLRFLGREGIRLAVFTGKGQRTTNITLRKLFLDGLFDMVVTGDDVQRHKPDPEGILRILSTFSLRPWEALMVGDSVSDVRASKAAGVRAAGAGWDCSDKDALTREGPDYFFAGVHEMTAAMPALLSGKEREEQ